MKIDIEEAQHLMASPPCQYQGHCESCQYTNFFPGKCSAHCRHWLFTDLHRTVL